MFGYGIVWAAFGRPRSSPCLNPKRPSLSRKVEPFSLSPWGHCFFGWIKSLIPQNKNRRKCHDRALCATLDRCLGWRSHLFLRFHELNKLLTTIKFIFEKFSERGKARTHHQRIPRRSKFERSTYTML